jgi:hypothetical protein
VGVRRRDLDPACRSMNALQQIIEGKHLAHGNRDLAINYKFFDWTLAAPSSRGK